MSSEDKVAEAGSVAFPKYKKERLLLGISEGDLLRRVLRPILVGQGLKDAADLNAAAQANGFPAFVVQDALGNQDVFALVIKSGPLNPSRATAMQQVNKRVAEALEAKLIHSASRSTRRPTKILVCTTGKISDKARTQLSRDAADSRIVLWDSSDIIERIDVHLPEFWLGADTEVAPYFRQLKKSLEDSSENLGISDLLPSGTIPSAVTDEMFVPLRLFRTTVRVQNRGGQLSRVPGIEQLPLTGIIRKPDRLALILGSAGSGKSTSLKRLAYIQAERRLSEGGQQAIPVLLRALDCYRGPDSLQDVARGAVRKIVEAITDPLNDQQFASGFVSVMIDSLDELPDDVAREAVMQKILSFHANFPRCQVILTSRPLPFFQSSQFASRFSQYTLAAIDFKQAEKIVTRLQKRRSLPAAKSQELLRRIQQVHGFELNPLLVTVFAATSEFDRKDVPANITELFKKYTEMMLGRWDASKGLGQQFHAPLKDFLLRKVAFEMHRRRVTSIPFGDFGAFIRAELGSRGHKTDADQLQDEIVNRSGLFRVVGGDIEFRHLLLQEFFAGRGIQSSSELITIVGDTWWQRAMVFYFGENPGDSDGLMKLTKALPGLDPESVYPASVTLGLSVQASYLVETKHKVDIILAVIGGLAASKESFMTSAEALKQFPVNSFLWYYLVGRDAVACSFLGDAYDQIKRRIVEGSSPAEAELRQFWLAVGLIESGNLAEARKLLDTFAPQDKRALFAAYLGVQLLRHVRIASTEEKRLAGEIAGELAPAIAGLQRQLLKELNTVLLEVRKGNVQPLLE